MSTWRERVSGETGSRGAYEWFEANYHYPVLALLAAFGLWLRTVNWERFVYDGTVLYGGNDPFYHLRSVQYAVANWPATMPFDPWTNFSYGTATSQFGTLFDQLMATAALIVGLGSPSESLVRYVVLFSPAVFGVLTFVPAYFIGRRLGGRFGGVIAVAILAVANGRLFAGGSVGTADHHVAEALFQALGVLGLMVAINVVEREKPVYELLAERAFGSMRRSIAWSVLAGIAIAMYIFVWPPGVFLLGVFGIFFVVYLSVEYVRGRSPEHVALAGAVAMGTAGALTLSTVQTFELNATARSLIQPLGAFGIAAGCVFMAWLARVYDDRDVSALAFPGTVVGIIAVVIVLLAVLAPETYGYLANNVGRIFGLGYFTSEPAATVGEVDPLPFRALHQFYGLAVAAAAAGGALVVYRQLRGDDGRGEEVLVLVWTAFMLLAALTQMRFANYITIPIAALNALLAGSILRYARGTSTSDGIETYQIMTVGIILLLVIAPMTVFASGNGGTVFTTASDRSPGVSIQGWDSSLEWMGENTPAPGQFAAPENESMDYLGTYARTDDFDYPGGAYGVLSWWDYGHWITVQANRIPNANPFQQGASHAARFLLSGEETAAIDELRDRDEADASSRYVMIDWQMADLQSKGSAPISFVEGANDSDFFSYVISEDRLRQTRSFSQSILAVRHKQPYYDSMVNRLYHYHGSARQPQPIVLEWRGNEQPLNRGTFTYAPAGNGSQPQALQRFESMSAAREYVAERPETRQLGGVGTIPTERVPALSHFRLVHVSEYSRYSPAQAGYSQVLNQTSPTDSRWTKTFERVPGATIEGTGPPNETITASVELQPNAGAPFAYTQRTRTDDDGQFNMTVPYATTGYDEWGVEEGYTDTSVRASGPYQLSSGLTTEDNTTFVHSASVNVTEGQVIGEDDSPATAELERNELSLNNVTEGTGNETAAPGGGESADGTDDGSADGEGSSGDDGSGGTDNETSPSLAAPAVSATALDADSQP